MLTNFEVGKYYIGESIFDDLLPRKCVAIKQENFGNAFLGKFEAIPNEWHTEEWFFNHFWYATDQFREATPEEIKNMQSNNIEDFKM